MSQMNCKEKIQDIKNNPEKHRHDFNGLKRCSMIDGALDLLVMQAHEDYAGVGSNGGVNCDVTSGPCSCGAWHKEGE